MEKFIKKISTTLAGIVVFLLAASFYLTMKGFVYNGEDGFILPQAYAEESKPQKEIPLNFAFPQDHVLGKKDAKVSIYEYSSFGCSHCADMHLEVMAEIIKKYVDNGAVRLVFVPLPLDKNSMDAALLAECVAKDKYFDFANLLFKKQRDWMLSFDATKMLKQFAALSGVSNDKINVCLKDDKTAARVLGDRKAGLSELGIQGTPSFIISSKKGNDMLTGAKTFDEMSAVIDGHLQAVYK
ncbi:MAG: DsbA family protein [Alphaproteobacteria bacterium]|nr:DsbA family protein [Alphaproteobacteria bacterium]